MFKISFLEKIYTISAYDDVVKNVVREPEIRHGYGRQSTKVSEYRIFCMDLNKVVDKKCSDDSDYI